MTPLADYIANMRSLCASAPDRRTGRNARLAMADIGMAAFAVFFPQSPSFLSAQKQIETRQGRSNAKTLFGIDQLPSDNHIRSMLDGVPPEHFDAMFYHVIDHLEQQDALDPLRRLNGRMLKNGEVQNFHVMLGASIVAPGTSSLLPLPRSSSADGMGPQRMNAASRDRTYDSS